MTSFICISVAMICNLCPSNMVLLISCLTFITITVLAFQYYLYFNSQYTPLFILHNLVIFGLLFFQMGTRKTHRNLWKRRWEVSWATCYQQSVSLPHCHHREVKSMGGSSQLQCNANLRLLQDKVLLKMQVHHDKLKRNVKALALGEFLLLLLYYSNSFRKLETEHL